MFLRKGEHKTLVTHNNSSYYKMLHPATSNRMLDFTEVTLKASCSYESNPLVQHDGEECGYVLKGELTVHLGSKQYVLQEGDSIYFDCNTPHKYVNNGEEDCISIWAMTPKFY